MKAIGYIRVSTAEQAKEGISLEHQAEKIRAYAKLHDIELVDIVGDEGRTGKALKGRPAAKKVIGMALSGEVEAVIVYKLDRMFRNAAEALEVSAGFNKAGASLHSVTEKLDTQSAMGKFFFTIAAAFAEMERNLISERTKDALGHKRANGQVYNHVPYGYKKQGGKLVKDTYEQGQLIWMKGKRDEGWTFLQIAEQLNKNEVPTKGKGWTRGLDGTRVPSGKVAAWQPQTVKNILDRAPIGEGK